MKHLKYFFESSLGDYDNKFVDESEWESKWSDRIDISGDDFSLIMSKIVEYYPRVNHDINLKKDKDKIKFVINKKSSPQEKFNIEIFETDDEWFYLKYYKSDPYHKTQMDDYWKCDSLDGLFKAFETWYR